MTFLISLHQSCPRIGRVRDTSPWWCPDLAIIKHTSGFVALSAVIGEKASFFDASIGHVWLSYYISSVVYPCMVLACTWKVVMAFVEVIVDRKCQNRIFEVLMIGFFFFSFYWCLEQHKSAARADYSRCQINSNKTHWKPQAELLSFVQSPYCRLLPTAMHLGIAPRCSVNFLSLHWGGPKGTPRQNIPFIEDAWCAPVHFNKDADMHQGTTVCTEAAAQLCH